MKQEIINILLEIANTIGLGHNDYFIISNNINLCNYDELATKALKLYSYVEGNNSKYQKISKYFIKLEELFKSKLNILEYEQKKLINIGLLLSKYPNIFIDACFINNEYVLTTKKIKIMIPESLDEKIMYELFQAYNYSLFLPMDRPLFKDIFWDENLDYIMTFNNFDIGVILYNELNNGDIIINEYNTLNNETDKTQKIISKDELALKYNIIYNKPSFIQSNEDVYVDAFARGGIRGFIQVMKLKNKINFNKVKNIRKLINERKEVNNNGLSKTSRITLS